MSSSYNKINEFKSMSPDNSSVTIDKFHAFGRDKIKFDYLKIALQLK